MINKLENKCAFYLKMKLFGSRFVFTFFVIVAGFLYLVEIADGANEFRRCYNTSIEMHCFDLQYDSTNRQWLTASFDNARQRCNVLNSTLLIIKDNETNSVVQNYMTNSYSPIRFQNVWMDAYRIIDNNNTYTLHWLNPKLPTLAASEVGYKTFIYDGSYYTTTLEFRSDNRKPQFYLTAKRPQDTYSYLCEYSVSRCSSNGSNTFQLSDRCYISFITSVTWYEARNRCLKDGGDLASFANITNINFTSWLGSDPNVRFWIGLRFSWYIWKDSGEEIKFSKWTANFDDWSSLCVIVCSNCNPSFSWSSKDCDDAYSVNVVCHSVTPLGVTTTKAAVSVAKTASSAAVSTSVSNANIHQAISPSSNAADGAVSVGIGLGVGLGVPLIIFIILTVVFAVKIKRMETLQEQKTRNDTTELAAVHETAAAGKVNDSANSQYQQLNRSVDNSPGTAYDELRVSPETPYEEFPSQRN